MTTREEFLSKCATVAADVTAEIDQSKTDISRREQVLVTALQTLQTEIFPRVLAAPKGGEKALDELVRQIEVELTDGYRAWINGVDELRKKMDWRGKDGRDQTLIIFVYGAVKAGKSSLGNYIAHGHSDPAEQSRSGAIYFLDAIAQNPDQLVAAQAALTNAGKLGVDFLEATSTIQGFRLPGLTWVDSPGLHSKTAENGDLAALYVDAADLVLYVMSGDSPGRRTEMNSLDDLIILEKPVLVAITRADMCEEDVDDDGNLIRHWVMRPNAERRQMETYVQNSFAERCAVRGITPLHPEIVTLSVKCAEEGDCEETGIPDLFSQISGVLDQAATLKRQAPSAALQSLINQVRTGGGGAGLTQLRRHLESARKDCVATRKRFHACRDAAQGVIRGAIVPEVERALRGKTDIAHLNTHLPAICDEISSRLIQAHLVGPLNQVFANWDRSVLSMPGTAVGTELPRFEDIEETVKVSNKRTGGAVGGSLGGLLVTAVVTTIEVTATIAIMTTPVGLAIVIAAGLAATAVGSAAGAAMAGSTSHKFKVGTNIETVKTEVIGYLQRAVAESVSRTCDILDSSLIGVIDHRLAVMETAFARFETTLTQEVLI